MAPFSIPAPLIIPLRLPVFGGPKSIDSNTKLQLLCETYLEHEIFYTLDGTKPQPYARIVQGSKTIKYTSPFCLLPGKNTIRAIAINANIHSMCSNVVTKCFEVLKAEGVPCAKEKQPNRKKQVFQEDFKKSSNQNGKTPDAVNNKCNSMFSKSDENNDNCFEEAFIYTLEDTVEVCNLEDSVDDNLEDSVDERNYSFVMNEDEFIDNRGNLEESEGDKLLDDSVEYVVSDHISENSCEVHENSIELNKSNLDEENPSFNANSSQRDETNFCCLKCDLTLQQCLSCKRMNAVSSKYCIECGTKLTQICFYCKTHNPSVAVFCQCCGKKLNTAIDETLDTCTKVDCCIMAKPKLRHAGIQKIPILINKCTQTFKDVTPVKKSSLKYNLKMPHQSPGRGYWHQQLDYICNHIKSHAYNNLEFRKTISEPILCDFQSATVTKDENYVTIAVVFSPFNAEKSNFSETEEIKSKDSL